MCVFERKNTIVGLLSSERKHLPIAFFKSIHRLFSYRVAIFFYLVASLRLAIHLRNDPILIGTVFDLVQIPLNNEESSCDVKEFLLGR